MLSYAAPLMHDVIMILGTSDSRADACRLAKVIIFAPDQVTLVALGMDTSR
jgi:hypothetical protein